MANNDELDAPEQLLTPSEVAALFRVNPKTVTRWARAGKLTAIRTLGGHRRFRVSEIRRCLEEMAPSASPLEQRRIGRQAHRLPSRAFSAQPGPTGTVRRPWPPRPPPTRSA